MTEDPAQIEVSLPALTKGLAFKVIGTVAFSAGHGEIIPLAVNVKVTAPVAPEEGINVAFNVLAFGKKVPPELEDHVPPVAPPVIDPDKLMG
jgi:hypothetical protein